MAQGAVKKPAKSVTVKKNTQQKPHRTRVVKPKKASLIQTANLKKKATSGLTGKTERLLAEKAGHLELLRGGKREGRVRTEGKGKDAGVKK